jgi:hypothetical protein
MRSAYWMPHEKEMLRLGIESMKRDPNRLHYVLKWLEVDFDKVPKRVVDSLTSRAQFLLRDRFVRR